MTDNQTEDVCLTVIVLAIVAGCAAAYIFGGG